MRHANDNVLEGEPKRTESQAQTPPRIGGPLVICTQISMLIISWHIFKYTEVVCIIYSFLCPQNEYLMSLPSFFPQNEGEISEFIVWGCNSGVFECVCASFVKLPLKRVCRVGKTFLTEAKTRQCCECVFIPCVRKRPFHSICADVARWVQRWTHFKESVLRRFDSDLASADALMGYMEISITGGLFQISF